MKDAEKLNPLGFGFRMALLTAGIHLTALIFALCFTRMIYLETQDDVGLMFEFILTVVSI